MFRTFERIKYLCAFWDPIKLTLFTLLTYNYYLKVLWLCVFNAVPIFEYCSVFLLLLNVLLFLASSVITISMVLAVCGIGHVGVSLSSITMYSFLLWRLLVRV